MKINKWYSGLSGKQKLWLFGSILVMLAISGIGLYLNPDGKKQINEAFTTDMTIKQIAPKLGVTDKSLAKELKLNIDAPKRKSLSTLNVSDHTLQHAVEHLLSHRDSNLKYFIYFALVFGAIIFLLKLGRPDRIEIKQKKFYYPRSPYILFLLISVIFCGFVLGKSPNPMEGAVKVFKSVVGLYPDPLIKIAAFIFFIALAVVANKVICGWACPFGALQELIYSIPIFRKIKKIKIPFWITNSIRAVLFFAVLVILFGIVGGKKGLVLYHYINPFNLFNIDFDSVSIPITIISVLVIAFIFYRPFCQLICPFGFLSWISEKFSIFRIRIDHEKCTNCNACIEACPLNAANAYVENKKLGSDCFSCGRCLNTCSFDAIKYDKADKHK